MSEEVSQSEEKMGCGAWLGVALLVCAVGAVVYFLLVKPLLVKYNINSNAVEHVTQQAADVKYDMQEKASETIKPEPRKEKVPEVPAVTVDDGKNEEKSDLPAGDSWY